MAGFSVAQPKAIELCGWADLPVKQKPTKRTWQEKIDQHYIDFLGCQMFPCTITIYQLAEVRKDSNN